MNVLNERSSVECYFSTTVGNEIVYCPAGVVPSSRVAESGSKRHCVRAYCIVCVLVVISSRITVHITQKRMRVVVTSLAQIKTHSKRGGGRLYL